jgi:hypothetical protein
VLLCQPQTPLKALPLYHVRQLPRTGAGLVAWMLVTGRRIKGLHGWLPARLCPRSPGTVRSRLLAVRTHRGSRTRWKADLQLGLVLLLLLHRPGVSGVCMFKPYCSWPAREMRWAPPARSDCCMYCLEVVCVRCMLKLVGLACCTYVAAAGWCS